MSTDPFDLRPPEFQAVMVVDYDTLLFPLTESIPSCLLPIANRKLLAYQLDMLIKSGITETIVVTPPDYEDDLRTFLNQYGVTVGMKIDIVVVDDFNGTADGLRAASERIRGDFIYLDCNFICQASLADLVSLHRSSSSDFTMMLSKFGKDVDIDESNVQYIGLSNEGRLLMTLPALQLEGSIRLPKHLLHRASSFNLRNDLQDLGIYVMSHWLLDLLKENHRMTCVKSDLIPFLVQRQFQSSEFMLENIPSIEKRKRPLSVIGSWLTSPSQRQTDLRFQTILTSQESESDDLLRCYAVVYEPPSQSPSDKGQPVTPFLLTKLSSIASYLNVNKDVPLINYNNRTPWTRVSNYLKKETSVVGDNVDMGDKSVTFKQCFIGNNCKIGQKAKLNNCVIMDNVVIGDNCVIQNSVICERAVIESNSNLNDCNVGTAYKIPSGTKVKGESFSANGH